MLILPHVTFHIRSAAKLTRAFTLTASLVAALHLIPGAEAQITTDPVADYAEATIFLMHRGRDRLAYTSDQLRWNIKIAFKRVEKYRNALSGMDDIHQDLPEPINANVSWSSSIRYANQLMNVLENINLTLRMTPDGSSQKIVPSDPLEGLQSITQRLIEDENDLNLPMIMVALRFEEALIAIRTIDYGHDDAQTVTRQPSHVFRLKRMLDWRRTWSITHRLRVLHQEQRTELMGLAHRAVQALETGRRWAECGRPPTNPQVRDLLPEVSSSKSRVRSRTHLLILLEVLLDQAHELTRTQDQSNELDTFVPQQRAYRQGVLEGIALVGYLTGRAASHIFGAVPEDLRYKSRQRWTDSDKQRNRQSTEEAESAKRNLQTQIARLVDEVRYYNDFMIGRFTSSSPDESHPRSPEMDERRPLLELLGLLETTLRTYRNLGMPGDERRYYQERSGSPWPHRVATGQLKLECCTTVDPEKEHAPFCNWRD